SIAAERGVDTVIMIPDEFLAQNVAKQTPIKIITWKGHCEVHERFTAADIRSYREANPGVVVLAHPECPPEVIAEADFTGSTSGMISYVGSKRPKRVVLVTECSMSDNVAVEYPDVEFVRPCNLCPHMKRITLEKILHSLETMTTEVVVDPFIAARAKAAVEAMLKVQPKAARVERRAASGTPWKIERRYSPCPRAPRKRMTSPSRSPSSSPIRPRLSCSNRSYVRRWPRIWAVPATSRRTPSFLRARRRAL